MLENKYCVAFSYNMMLPKESQELIKEAKLKELAAEVIPLLEIGKRYGIAVDYFEEPVDLLPYSDVVLPAMMRGNWTISVEPARIKFIEVPKIESPHYKLPVTDSLKERAAAAWNYFRGKGEIS